MGVDFSSFMIVEAQMSPEICGFVIMSQKIIAINIPKSIKDKMNQLFKIQSFEETNAKERKESVQRYSLRTSIIQTFNANHDVSPNTRMMFCQAHKLFCEQGWSLLDSPILSYRHTISSWFFNKNISPILKTNGSTDDMFCAIGLSGIDGIQFIYVAEYIVNEIKTKVQSILPSDFTVTKVRPINEEGCVQFDVGGRLWMQSESIEGREVLIILVKTMHRYEWELINSTPLQPSAPDTLFFRRFSKKDKSQIKHEDSHFLMGLMKPNWIAVFGLKNADIVRNYISDSLIKYEKIHTKTLVKKECAAIEMEVDIWSRTTNKEYLTKRSMTLLFQDLAAKGWLVTESLDYCRTSYDLNSFLFRRVHPLRLQFCCIMPQKTNGSYSHVILLNTPENVISTCHKAIQDHLGHATLTKTHEHACIRFIGNSAYDTLNTKSKILFTETIMSLTNQLRILGWNLTTSGDSCMETAMEGQEHKHLVRYTIYSLWFSKKL